MRKRTRLIFVNDREVFVYNEEVDEGGNVDREIKVENLIKKR